VLGTAIQENFHPLFGFNEKERSSEGRKAEAIANCGTTVLRKMVGLIIF